ncbi:MAG TPA: thiamine-phosphate kinase [Thermoanaerobaculia bacterium]|nr:thiamine-phosphate kinase [Thermoanaerobaculia bacterium]
MGAAEREMIAKLAAAFPEFREGMGIGDDAALLRNDGTLAIGNDMLIEDVDFTASIPIELVAEKALASNLSDLAAMGASPLAFLLALGCPESFLPQFDRFVKALAAVSRRYGIMLIGGDISRAPQLILSITAIGRVPARVLLRSGASPGQRIFISRPLGASAAGLRLLTSGWTIAHDHKLVPPAGTDFGYAEREFASAAIMRHVAPEPEVTLGPKLAAMSEVTACIDISDGLSSDLKRLCEASGTGAIVDWDRLPAFADLPAHARMVGAGVADLVLHGGEEYALLFTSSLTESQMSSRLGRVVYAIGRIAEGQEILLERDGKREVLPAGGYEHFA